MKEVLIEIRGAQEYDNGVSDESTFTTNGKLCFENDGIKLFYDEGEMIGAPNVKSEISVENNNRVTLSRTGAVKTRMIIEQGKRHSCFYSTPQGDFVIGIFGDKLHSSFDENGGKIKMNYTIDVNSGLVSKNTMEITIKELK